MPEPSAVYVFSREYPPVTVGGTSTVARSLGAGLTALGRRVVVVTTGPGAAVDRREVIDGVVVHRVTAATVYNQDTGLTDESFLVHRRLYRTAVDLVAEFGRPSAVLLPDLFCYPEASLFAGAYRAPLVNVLLQDFRTLTRHDRDTHRVTSGVAARQDDLLAVEEKALRGSDHVAFISNALSNAINGYYPDLSTPNSVVNLGVDRAEIASIAAADAERAALLADLPAHAEGRQLVVACGRLVPVKGFAELLTAVALLDTPDRHVVLVGVGPEEPRLRRLAGELGVERDVTFAGDVPRRTALLWMSLAAVAVVPSLWESFCYVCAEMMALGRPVVATAVDSLNELLPDEEHGYRVPVASPAGRRTVDPADLAAAIAAALRDPAEAARRAGQGRARVLGRFTNDRFAVGIAAVCDEVGAVQTNA